FEGAEGIDVLMPTVRKDGLPGAFEREASSQHAQGGAPTADPELARGSDLFAALARAVANRPEIDVRWDSPARRPLRAAAGRVAGVEIATAAGPRELRSRQGVVLTTGGYGHDEGMKANYLKAPGIHFYGNPGNTGDGVRMAQAVGADLWHMNQMIGRGVGHFDL